MPTNKTLRAEIRASYLQQGVTCLAPAMVLAFSWWCYSNTVFKITDTIYYAMMLPLIYMSARLFTTAARFRRVARDLLRVQSESDQ